jgi:DNA helicase-2/ATP-dependent DNA helicase PcrA
MIVADTEESIRDANVSRWRESLRLQQRALADWRGGRLAISAVPGAGKSHSMAVGAALTIYREGLTANRQLAIVTLTRSAAANIRGKIDRCLRELGLPLRGYTATTIHGLALQIISRYPDLAGIGGSSSEGNSTIVPTVQHRAIKVAVGDWMAANWRLYGRLLEGKEFDGEETERMRRSQALRGEILPNLALQSIKEAKSSGISPALLAEIGESCRDEYAILTICAGLYGEYQQFLAANDLLDYDEMILGALRVLRNPVARDYYQQRYYGVFEDEAQDSSKLQEELLTILAGDDRLPQSSPNFVRVGDPNQAINSTFTPANPRFFVEFFAKSDHRENMDVAGRSAAPIMQAANAIVRWGNHSFASSKKFGELVFKEQDIHGVGTDDPQPNPLPEGSGVEVCYPADIYESMETIVTRITELFAKNPVASIAILVRENRQAKFVYHQLQSWQEKHSELTLYQVGESDRVSEIPREMLSILQFLQRPHSPDNLKAVLTILLKRKIIPTQDIDALSILPETFLYPDILDPKQRSQTVIARDICRELLQAKLNILPDRLTTYCAQKLNYNDIELATTDKLSDRIYKQNAGCSSLDAIVLTLGEIIAEEKFADVDLEADDRYTASRQVTIITMHKSKGLDWDYVFIPFLHEEIIPGSLYVPQNSKFLGDYTLAEIARAQIRAYLYKNPNIDNIQIAWEKANFLKQAEELRLLYVAVTRAKKLCWLAAETEAPFIWRTFDWQRGGQLKRKKPCPVLGVIEAILKS